MRTGPAVVAIVALIGLAACTDVVAPRSAVPSVRTTVPASALVAIHAEIRQSRSDWAARVVQVRVYDDGTEPVVVSGVALTTPGVDGVSHGRPRHPPTVDPGDDRDESVALRAPACGGDDGAAHVVISLADAAGATAELALVAADPQRHLARIRAEDCAAAAVARGATLAWGTGVEATDRAGTLVGSLDLTMTPVAGGPTVVITQIDGTVLLSPLVAGAPTAAWAPTELAAPRTAPVTVPLTFVPARCDPHAVAEDKRGTFVGVHGTVDGIPQHVFYLGVSDATRGELHDYIGRACGW